ncbi:MAG: efflux RND transporter periplasmic adaptor subunit [Eubacterium sp.]|nr:efflux RND transporter periplasmic adaptor subunit [Eubacterium sp.]
MKKWFKKHKKGTIILSVVVVAAIAAAVILPKTLLKGKESTQKMQAKQNTIQLSKMDLTSSISATGTLESANSKTVSASVSNVKIKKVLVSEGDTVKKGQSLVTFDESELQTTLSDAKESLSDTITQNAAQLKSAKRKLSDAKETYTSQKKKLQKEVASAKKIYEAAKKAVSQAKNEQEKTKANQTLQQAKSAYEQAVSQQTSSNKQNKESIENAKESVTTTENSNKKSLKEAQKSVDDATEALENCAITAPISGTVTAVGVEAGDTYSGGDMFEISDCSKFQVSTTVSEYDIANVKKGQKVVILTDATDDTEIQGEITYVALTTGSSLSSSSSSSSGNGATAQSSAGGGSSSSSSSSSVYEVTIKVKDSNDKLRVGMTAKCSIILKEAKDVYAVPYDAIHTNNSGDSVIYVQDGTSKKEVTVTKGMESDYYVAVSGDDLSEGLNVIIPSDSTSSSSSKDSSDSSSLSGMLGGGGGNMGGGAPSGGGPGGGGPGM